ncbi:MAG: hypothetical protein QNJ17_17080, partial [Desulfocapsaceae bacterium]|nr:hypothetical protein [Desulfocapsaceae bacterium]
MKSRSITIAFLLSLCIFLSAIIVFLLLPFIGNKYLIPGLTKKLPFDQSVVNISRITPWSTHGSLSFANGDQTTLSIARFEADYSPSSLLQGRISRVLLDAATIHLQIENSRPGLRGFPNWPVPSEQKAAVSLPVLPFTVDRIDLTNVQVAIHTANDISHYINLDAELIPAFIGVTDGGHKVHAAKLDFTTQGALHLKGELAIKPQAEDHQLTVRVELAKLAEVLPNLTFLSPWRISGELDVEGDVLLEGLQNIGEYSIIAEASNFYIQGNGLEVGLAAQEKQATLQLNGDSQKVKYSLTGLAMTKPEPISLETGGLYEVVRNELEGSFRLFSGRTDASVTGEYRGKVGKKTVLSYETVGEGFSLENGIEVDNYSANGEIEYGEGSLSGSMRAAVAAVSLPEKEISLRGISVDLP